MLTSRAISARAQRTGGADGCPYRRVRNRCGVVATRADVIAATPSVKRTTVTADCSDARTLSAEDWDRTRFRMMLDAIVDGE